MVDVPADAFRPSTNTKTHLLFLKKRKNPNRDHSLFLSYALTCGHDKRRRPIRSDDMNDIPDHIKNLRKGKSNPSSLGIFIKNTDLKNGIRLPKYYNLNLPVFINLIVNAIQAMPQGGEIKMTISESIDTVIIDFIDSGTGIPEKDLDKVFEPLFTTKQKGTGLGLASCKNIVEQHEGTISVLNNPTTFRIILPKNLS